jgi:hypothetical protein
VSDVSQGPGWWIASDDKWYPPETHPDRIGKSQPVADPGAFSPGVDEPTSPPAGASEPPASAFVDTAARSTPAPGRAKVPVRLWVLGAAAMVALTAVALVVALTSKSTALGLPIGSERATITITVPPSGRPSFSGTVAGRQLSGSVTGTGTVSTSTVTGSGAVNFGDAFDYSGSLGGHPYALHVALVVPSGGSGLLDGGINFDVSGTYGSEPVIGTARFVVTSPTARTLTVPFGGSVGTQSISGSASATERGDGSLQVVATFSVH